MKEINITDLPLKVVDLWMNQWLLLTSGTMDNCNMMTVAWVSIGCMWSKPFAQIVVRPQRHTRQFMDSTDSFTLCAFPDEYREALQELCDSNEATVFFDAYPFLTSLPKEEMERLFFQTDPCHLTAPGHRYLAEEISHVVREMLSKRLASPDPDDESH